MNVTELFCDVDDFCQVFIPSWMKSTLPPAPKGKKRNRKFRMSPAEIMTLLILFHRSHYRDFKSFYTAYVPQVLNNYFPERLSYNRFIELSQSVLIPLCAYLQTRTKVLPL